ncbi:MAG: hypothetical protein J0I28_04745 [Caulobacterales bacterium]|nr:hypothetical protein [Caulobacterales bacterium]
MSSGGKNLEGGAAAAVDIPSVSSIDQRNGVTAGYVNQLNQTVLPTLVRGPQLERFKSTFTAGAKLKRQFTRDVTDSQIDELCDLADKWVNDTYNWLNGDVSEYAAERFIFRPPGNAYSYNLPGDHSPGYADKWGGCQQGISALLVNLDQLMRDPSIYPEGSVEI